ncbi:MAG: hypothetical protein HC800_14340 [Phormidesmis sp. RL_2_1]|nr:hypothetical protein [Phormidesmis sp. RL_2_1]
MSNPFRSLKYLPWSALLLSAGLTVLFATAIDITLIYILASSPTIFNILNRSAVLVPVLFMAAAFGVGALSIVVTANFSARCCSALRRFGH